MSSFDSKSRENLHNTISMSIALDDPTIVGRIPLDAKCVKYKCLL
ncbi:hypothetical protein [Metaclostridioides mangenotii]|nr:hypothetical protein [Clostridioides mangenotii]